MHTSLETWIYSKKCSTCFLIAAWAILFLSSYSTVPSCESREEEDALQVTTRLSSKLSERFNRTLSFEEAFSAIWGQVQISDSAHVRLQLDKHSGSGFVSLDNYMYAYYSASIKLPQDYTAGIVLAFYTSNGDDFPQNHDELDFEFLGNVKGKPWRLQTNIYGNGSVSRGREERFNFWFDPTTDFHNYSILWNHKHIVFMVDDVPIREMKKSVELGGDYPSKPMALYATMWDGSSWATNGGKYGVNYKYAPFITSFHNLKMEGCATNPVIEEEETESTTQKLRSKMDEYCLDNPVKVGDLWALTASQQQSLQWVRSHFLYYTYCQDTNRHYTNTSLPECLTQVPIKSMKPRRGFRGHHVKPRPRATVSTGRAL